jgi:solute carrier family 25 carnitine/acylcarnitine transporter 20/29
MPMFTGTLQQAVMLGCNRLAQQWWNVPSTFTKDHPKSDRTLRDWVKLGLSGSFAGVISSLLVCPSDKVKIRLQIHEIRSLQYNWKQPRYYGPLQCVQDIVKRGGFVKGLYRGYSIVLMREAIYAFAYFPAYEASKSTLSRLVNGLNMRQGDGLTLSKFIEVAVSGGIAGCVGWSVILPIDCIKSRLQADRFPHQYAGVIDCFRKTVAQGGWRTLFAGWKPILLRAFPLHATVFATYESLKAYYQTINQKMLIL